MTSDVQDLINTVQDLNALLASYYASLSSAGIDESQTAEIRDNIKQTLDNITATQAALNAALVGVHAQATATLDSDAVDPALTAGTEAIVSPGYKTPVKMVGLNTGSITPRTGTVMKLFALRGVSASILVAPNGGGLWHDGDPKSLVPFVGFDPDVSVNIFT